MRKEKKLGIAQKRHYDLPLHQDAGTGFLFILVGLMAFLMALVLSFSIGLQSVMNGWSAGLENKITIEIPAEDETGLARSPVQIKALQDRVEKAVSEQPFVNSIEIVSNEELEALIQPWLGSGSLFDDLPMPGLLSAELSEVTPQDLSALESVIVAIAPDIHIDRHEKWLADLFRLTGSMQFVLLCFVAVIGLTTVAAVAGAVKSQIEIHRSDVELLHLMGAYDRYIVRQFVRHSSFIVLVGGFAGVILSALILGGISVFLSMKEYSLLPDFSFHPAYFVWLLALPLLLWGISVLSTRTTVSRVLSRMP